MAARSYAAKIQRQLKMLEQFRLGIELDHEQEDPSRRLGNLVFRAGSVLKGNVLIHVRRQITADDLASKSLMSVHGFEQTSVPISTSRIHRSIDPIFNEIVPLIGAGRTTLEPGMHTFPFSVRLPESLPTSLGYGQKHNGCVIQYAVVATVNRRNCQRYFMVRAAPFPANLIIPSVLEPQTEVVRSVGVKRAGTISFGASLSNSHVCKGDSVEVSLACRNNSAIDIVHIEMKLFEKYTWSAAQESSTAKRLLWTFRNIELPSLRTGKLSWSEVREQQRTGVDVEDREAIQEDLNSNESKLQIHIPLTSRDTVEGKHLNVSHYVKIYFRTEAFVNNLTAKIPLQIGWPSPDWGESERVVFTECEDDGPVPFAAAVAIHDGDVGVADRSTPFGTITLQDGGNMNVPISAEVH